MMPRKNNLRWPTACIRFMPTVAEAGKDDGRRMRYLYERFPKAGMAKGVKRFIAVPESDLFLDDIMREETRDVAAATRFFRRQNCDGERTALSPADSGETLKRPVRDILSTMT
jgi:hypothetical protein